MLEACKGERLWTSKSVTQTQGTWSAKLFIEPYSEGRLVVIYSITHHFFEVTLTRTNKSQNIFRLTSPCHIIDKVESCKSWNVLT